MEFFFRVILIVVALCLDMIFSGYFYGSLILPNVTLMLVVVWTILMGFTESIGWILLAGVFSDLLLFRPFGSSILLFVIATYGFSFLSRRFFPGNFSWMTVSFLGVILFSIGVEMLAVFASWGLREGSSLISFWVTRESMASFGIFILLNALFFFMIYKGMNRFEIFFSYYKRKIQPKRYV